MENQTLPEVILPREPISALDVQRATESLELAEIYEIDGLAMRDAAVEEVKTIKAFSKELDAKRKTMTVPLDQSKAAIMTFFKPPLDMLAKAETLIKNAILAYDRKEEAKRKAAEEEARKAAEAEKARLRAEAEAREAEQRRQREAAEKAEREAREAKDQAERERLEAEATKRRQAAEQEAEHAKQLAMQEAMVQSPIINTVKPAKRGTSTRELWAVNEEDIDLKALAQAVADGTVPVIAIKANMKFLKEQARSLKEHMNIPGVKAVPKDSLAVRS